MNNLVYVDDVLEHLNKNYIDMFTSLTDSRACAVEAIGSLIIDLSQELSKSHKYYTFDINVFMLTLQGYVDATLKGEEK